MSVPLDSAPSSPNDTICRLCIRVVASSQAFLLAGVLPSTTSVETGVPLFGCFSGTTTPSDSRFVSVSIRRVLSFTDTSLRPFAFGEGTYRVSRFPRNELPHMLWYFDSAVACHTSPYWYDRCCFPFRSTRSAYELW